MIKRILLILFFLSFFIVDSVYCNKLNRKSLEGKDAPKWALKTIDGKFEFLDNYSAPIGQKLRGKNKKNGQRKVVVLSFFATWCQPCIKEIGELHKLQKQYSDKPVVFFLVDLTEYFRGEGVEKKYVQASNASEFLEKKGLNDITVLNDNRGIIAERYGVSSVLPRLFVIDKYQKIQMDEQGLCPSCIQDDVANKIEKLLNE